MNKSEAKVFVDEFYKKVAARWNERVTQGPFMKKPTGWKFAARGIARVL